MATSSKRARSDKRGRKGARLRSWARSGIAALLAATTAAGGCTTPAEYIHNGFKVGPNYSRPPAPVAKQWIDANDVRLRQGDDNLKDWWKVFNDPALDSMICLAYQQNLTLRQAGFRVLEARAQLGIDIGELFPQSQQMTGSFTRNAISVASGNATSLPPSTRRWFDQWSYGFALSWELDFWGRFRRAVEADSDTLDASIENYDDALVTLLGDLATDYATYRTTELRIKYARDNVRVQQETLDIVTARFRAGTGNELDVVQARSTLEATEATIPALQITLRQTANAMCVLLGIPPEDLSKRLGAGAIPKAPVEVAVGIPADLLRRRPDVRAAERQAAAQCAQIGVAESMLYPHFFINGNLGWSAERLKQLFTEPAFNGSVGPSFQWNLLQYGRLLNAVRLQDATFQQFVANYQNTVLNAAEDVENFLVQFLKAQEQTKDQRASVEDAEKGVVIVLAQYKAGTVDFTRVTQLEQALAVAEDGLAVAEGSIATGLIGVYRALGGGWQLRLTGCDVNGAPAGEKSSDKQAPSTDETLPQPRKDQKPSPAQSGPVSLGFQPMPEGK